MYVGMGLIQNEHGVWIVRRRVQKRLREPVARVLNNGKDRQTFLQKSTATKDKKEATRLAPAILVEFGKILDEAEALLAERPLRTSLAQSEIDRIAEFHYASVLAGDEEFTSESAQADEDFVRSVARQFDEAGIEYDMPPQWTPNVPPTGSQTVRSPNEMQTWNLCCRSCGLHCPAVISAKSVRQ
jgi:hypothetical protein